MTEETNASESEVQLTPVEASVLLSGAEWDPKLLATTLAQEWEITVPEKDLPADASESLVFEAEGAVIAVKLFEEPLPAEMARMHAAMNPLWPQAGAMAQLHRAHLAVAAIPKSASLVEAAQVLVKVVSSLCNQPSALAIDTGSTILGTDGYREGATVMKGGELPLFNLVTFAIAKADETNFVAFTMGMSFLGHNELEISPTAEKPEVIQEFLYTVASYTLKTGKGLRDGQILGLHPEKAQAVRYAESSMIPGLKTMQITL